MLPRLNKFLGREEIAGPPTAGADDMHALQAARAEALSARAKADSHLRNTEARMRGCPEPVPNAAAGEEWVKRPAAWSRAIDSTVLPSPASGTEVADDLKVFHDCALSETVLRQKIAPADAPAPFCISLDVLRFEGSFLSLCLQLDEKIATALTQEDILQIEMQARMESQVPVFARLNIKQGPNVHDRVAAFPFAEQGSDRAQVGFDLLYHQLETQALSGAWIDLIFDKPAMNLIEVQDIRISCRKRVSL